jgi:hypothetical protein
MEEWLNVSLLVRIRTDTEVAWLIPYHYAWLTDLITVKKMQDRPIDQALVSEISENKNKIFLL